MKHLFFMQTCRNIVLFLLRTTYGATVSAIHTVSAIGIRSTEYIETCGIRSAHIGRAHPVYALTAILRVVNIAQTTCIFIAPAGAAQRPPEFFARFGRMVSSAIVVIEHVIIPYSTPCIVIRNTITRRAWIVIGFRAIAHIAPKKIVPHRHPIADILIGIKRLICIYERGRIRNSIRHRTYGIAVQYSLPFERQ